MVVSGSLNRWDRWYFHHPIGSIYHLYTTYSPCQLGFLYATYQETPLTQFNNWGRLRATVPWIEITFLGSSHPCEGIICLTGNYRLWNGKWFGMIYIYTSNILYILNIHTYIYIYIYVHIYFLEELRYGIQDMIYHHLQGNKSTWSSGTPQEFSVVSNHQPFPYPHCVILLMEEIPNNHLGCIKPYEYRDIYYINWCRISSINSCSEVTNAPNIR